MNLHLGADVMSDMTEMTAAKKAESFHGERFTSLKFCITSCLVQEAAVTSMAGDKVNIGDDR
ncbi:hypothetical protein E2C01_039356 [Portunus trituberculatus]|uniref:Uncharacterized protein n=1 Tax=Portunus trituberculatus TaxID=210409 RepID=A0A5B7FDF9_PORTR|nr:hypothetical protein [Portunus trituberculatus]